MTKPLTCIKCGKPLTEETREWDKDGYPICKDCWQVEDEQLNKEIR